MTLLVSSLRDLCKTKSKLNNYKCSLICRVHLQVYTEWKALGNTQFLSDF